MRKTVSTLHSIGDTVYVDTAMREEEYLRKPEIKPYTAQCRVMEIAVNIDSRGCRISYVLKETRTSRHPGRILTFPESETRKTPMH